MAAFSYDTSNFALVKMTKTPNSTIIIADSRITNIDALDFTLFHEAKAPTLLNLGEFDEFKTVRFFITGKPQRLMSG